MRQCVYNASSTLLEIYTLLIVVRTFLFLYLVYLLGVKREIKRDLISFKNKNLENKPFRNRK